MTDKTKKLLLGYLPMAAAVVAAALFVSLVPTTSRSAPVSAGTTDEILKAVAGRESGGGTADSGTDGAASTGAGSAASDPGSGARGRASRAAAVGGGGWRPTGEDCSRQKTIESPLCRPTPAFDGNNGGATYKNIDPDEIRIVVYEPGTNAQVDALLGAFGASSSDDSKVIAALEVYAKYFNSQYETYGRKIRIIHKRGPGNASTPEEQTADAVSVATELKASFVLSAVGSTAFHDELARRGIPSIAGGLQFRAKWYEDRAPFVFSMVPDLDLTLDHVAEYWCKRVMNKKAKWAGDPLYQQQTRKLGIIYPNDNLDLTGGPLLAEKIKACGGNVVKMVSYASDVSTAQAQATNAVAQLRDAGVTTVACTCDPIAPVFFTNAATNQGWFPEWLQTGVLLTDLPDFGRLYNQQQWAHSFGTSVFPKYGPAAEGGAWKAYWATKPKGNKDEANAGAAYFSMLIYLVGAIEAAGPDLTPRTFAEGMFSQPAVGGATPDAVRASFGANGPSPYTAIDNVQEIWWDPTRPGPDGEPGYVFYVDGGRRRYLGEWPSNDPVVFVDDGSKQFDPDPNG